MKKTKNIKVLVSVMILLAMFIMLGQGLVFATENRNDQVELKLSRTRWVKDASAHTEKKAYALNTGSNHPVFQILSTSGTNKETNYLCLNATKGASWYNNSIGTAANYKVSYDLVEDKDTINTKLTSAYKTATGSNYTQIMWILDQIPIGTDFNVDTILAKAGIVYGPVDMTGTINAYYYDFDNITVPSVFAVEGTALNNNLYGNIYGNAMGYSYINASGTQQQVKLSKELIEVVEQAAIWYFTNGGTEYDCLTKTGDVTPKAWLRYAADPNASTITWNLLANDTVTGRDGTIDTGKMLQEQASILYNYLIDGANAAKNAGYTSKAAGSLKITPTEPNVVKEGTNFKIGPMKITSTNATITGGLKVTTGTDTDITSQATVTGVNKTSPAANTDFYVTVPKSSVNGSIIVTVNGTTSSVEKKLRIGNIEDTETSAEQAIVEVNSTPKSVSGKVTVAVEEQFDLAIRKVITAVAGKSLLNEDGNDATRTMNIDKSTIPNTATYKHRKDPIVVNYGDVITYKLHIYNEGEIDGYASEIVDQLPTGLKSTLATGSTITSDINNNVYKVSYDETSNKITLTIDTTETIKTTKAFKNNTLSEDTITLTARVTQQPATDGTTKHYLTNIAYIAKGHDSESNVDVTADRNGNESKTTESPNKTADQLNSTNVDDYKGKSSNQSVKNDTNNNYYYEGEQDDDDFEKVVVLPKKFDLALRKFISKVSEDGNFESTETTTTYNRAPSVDTSKLKAKTADTATYNHSKEPVKLNVGDYVLYTIRAYNEGDIDGYASQITDYLPEYLSFIGEDDTTDTYIKSINGNWKKDETNPRKIITQATAPNATTKLLAFDATSDNGNGSALKYVDVQIICKVNSSTPVNTKQTNIAEITEYKKEQNGDAVVVTTDKDSTSNNLDYPTNPETYKDDEINKSYVPGQEDDDDFEKVIVKEKTVDLALTKFITAVSKDVNIEDGEYLTPNKNIGTKTNEYIRATVADTTGLKNGTSTNATYSAKKDIEPLAVTKNDYILYNIRVYNEGEVDVYAGEITDYLPENLEFVEGEFNTQYGWTANGQTVKTTYLSAINGEDKKLKAFDKKNDDGKGSGMDYKDLPVLCKVSDKAESGKKMVNTAEITKYEDENGNEIPKDVDSTPENKEEKNVENREEDDDDYEVIILKNFDLALRKFITEIDTVQSQNDDSVSPTKVTDRIPKLGDWRKDESTTIEKKHPKNVLKVGVGDIITYTIRVYNEGGIAGYAEQIADDIPEYLEYLPEHDTNVDYKWVMYDKNGKETSEVKNAVRIITDYTSRANGAEKNLLKAFDQNAKISDTNPAYLDVKVAFKVKDPKSNKTIIVNKAEIIEDADEDGNPVEDIDSTPGKWNDGEDDQDYENVSVEYFDLSLLKYVTKAIVTENGKTKVTKTGNNGSDKDITPKVEIHRKKLNKTTVKFEYEIKITNEGDIAGYAKEITDYVPKGLKFYKQDNKGWKDEGNNVISTKLLEKTLLQPGESATVKVVLRWINGANNLGLKTNTAEISEDYNDKGVPDRDSTPDNKKPKEDDIDDAPVLLTISTGLEDHPVEYALGALAILTVLGTGIVLIKKYVL